VNYANMPGMESAPETLPLAAMARVAHVPIRWLREQATSGEIPALDAGGQLLFHVRTVEKILASRAAGQSELRKGAVNAG